MAGAKAWQTVAIKRAKRMEKMALDMVAVFWLLRISSSILWDSGGDKQEIA